MVSGDDSLGDVISSQIKGGDPAENIRWVVPSNIGRAQCKNG